MSAASGPPPRQARPGEGDVTEGSTSEATVSPPRYPPKEASEVKTADTTLIAFRPNSRM